MGKPKLNVLGERTVMAKNIEPQKAELRTDQQIEMLEQISSQLETISKDQKHIGKFVGESVHSIRKWVIFFGVLIIINAIISLFF